VEKGTSKQGKERREQQKRKRNNFWCPEIGVEKEIKKKGGGKRGKKKGDEMIRDRKKGEAG
jgi:hypothetical protein